MTYEKKWFFASCILGTVHAIAIMGICFLAIYSCEEQGQTFANNETCFTTPNIWNYRVLTFFCAYCTVDLFNAAVIQRDFSSGTAQTYFHHILGIVGCIFGIYFGGFLTVTSSVSAITEMSTPFVNFRYMLYDLEIRTGSLYLVNGTLMTLSFFIFRVVFQTWLVVYKLWPHVYDNNPNN